MWLSFSTRQTATRIFGSSQALMLSKYRFCTAKAQTQLSANSGIKVAND
jgi:hypothetical protein